MPCGRAGDARSFVFKEHAEGDEDFGVLGAEFRDLEKPLSTAAPSPSTIFYLSLLFIFLTAIITTVVTKWARDKCLKFFSQYHVTLERTRGQTAWGTLKVFSSPGEGTTFWASILK